MESQLQGKILGGIAAEIVEMVSLVTSWLPMAALRPVTTFRKVAELDRHKLAGSVAHPVP